MDNHGTGQAVILAAGSGKRLGAASKGRPKCLAEVGGETLIERQLRILHDEGINRVCVIVGYRKEEILSNIGTRCEFCDFIVNASYAETNSLYSLWLARKWVSGPFVLVNSDVLAHPTIYRRVLAASGSALAYDGSSGYDEEHMKVAVSGNLVRSISKTLPKEEIDGENVGILKFDEHTADTLFAEAAKSILAGDRNNWAPDAVSRLAKRLPIRAVNVADLPWIEIDFPEDLERAETAVLPLINRDRESVTPTMHSLQLAS